MANTYLFAGGGTGGHLFPGIAVARTLREMRPDARIVFLTSDRPLDRDLLSPTGFEQREQPVRPLSGDPRRWPGFWLAWRSSVAAARRTIREVRPAAVLGLGGYAAGPAVVAARRMGVRAAILNPDAVPGRANRHLARFADRIVLQWDVSRQFFAPDAPCSILGCPIRAGFSDDPPDRGGACDVFGLDAARPVLLVTGASQGARTVNDAIAHVWPEFRSAHPEWQLLHLTGAADEIRMREAYARDGSSARVLPFTHEMASAVAAADAVVSRAGASTLAELTALGRPSVLLPYPYHKDRHQHANARVLADVGAAVLVEDTRETARTAVPLRAALERLADAEQRIETARAALALGRPRAARDVAEWMMGA